MWRCTIEEEIKIKLLEVDGKIISISLLHSGKRTQLINIFEQKKKIMSVNKMSMHCGIVIYECN